MTNNTVSSLLNQIIGNKLSSVCFGLDDVHFGFDGPTISINSKITVEVAGKITHSGEEPFRNHLCDQIKKIVQQIEFIDNVAMIIRFEDQSSITASLKLEDYEGPEAAVLRGLHDEIMVLN